MALHKRTEYVLFGHHMMTDPCEAEEKYKSFGVDFDWDHIDDMVIVNIGNLKLSAKHLAELAADAIELEGILNDA